MDTSSLKLKQSGLSEPGYEKMKSLPQRYPGQFDDTSAKTDITEADIQTYVRRVAAKAMDRAESRGDYSGPNNYDTDVTVEDCPQNECYKQYVHGDIIKKLEPSKKIFYDGMKDIISSKPVAYDQPEDESYLYSRSRIDELLQNRNPRCDYNQVEKNADMEDLKKAQDNQGVCSHANPNRCDPVVPTEDCGNRQCYKKYLVDELNPNGEKIKSNVLNQSGMMRVRFSDTEETLLTRNFSNKSTEVHPNRVVQKDDFKKKYNTLVVNGDVAVPDFIDVLVVVSEKPIKITLPELSGPSLSSSVGKVASTSNIMIKNLSLCNHQIVTKGNNKIDTVRTSVSIEPAGKKTLGAIHDSWILF